jgi:hypothetical protein
VSGRLLPGPPWRFAGSSSSCVACLSCLHPPCPEPATAASRYPPNPSPHPARRPGCQTS